MDQWSRNKQSRKETHIHISLGMTYDKVAFPIYGAGKVCNPFEKKKYFASYQKLIPDDLNTEDMKVKTLKLLLNDKKIITLE